MTQQHPFNALSIDIPSDWEDCSVYTHVAPDVGNKSVGMSGRSEAPFRPSLVITREHLEKPIDMDDYAKSHLLDIKQEPAITLIEHGPAETPRVMAYQLRVSMTLEDNLVVEQVQAFVIIHPYAYILSYSYLPHERAENLKRFADMLMSFQPA